MGTDAESSRTDLPLVGPRATRDLLSIGELADATGLRVSTLRAWEARLGFPEPLRSSGGQRRYRAADVEAVLRVQAERERGLLLEDAVAVVRRERTVGDGSLFAGLRALHPSLDVLSLDERTMQSLTYSIEDECMAHASRPVLLGCFQDLESYRASGRRWRVLARSASRAMVCSAFEQTDASASPVQVALPADSPMLNEWSVVCLDPQLSVVLCAWEQPPVAGGKRRFEGFLSLDPVVVRDAVRLWVKGAGADSLPTAEDLMGIGEGGTAEDPRRSASLLRRFAAYVSR